MKNTFKELSELLTEQRNPASYHIDKASIRGILSIINKEDQKVPHAVAKAIKSIEKAVKLYVQTIKNGGRIYYIGAGTSGRLGVQDAAELPPTFNASPSLVQGIIAGGYKALWVAQEGTEDKKELAIADLKKRRVKKNDLLIGLAACKRTPYVVSALKYAQKIGAKTILITAIPKVEVDVKVTLVISIPVGPEVITGSTRMKAGTAEKLVLNMISTASMIRLGKVYQNLMVDLRATSFKLRERAKRILMITTGCSYRQAVTYLKKAQGNVKTAIVMILTNSDLKEAQKRLRLASGFVEKAIKL